MKELALFAGAGLGLLGTHHLLGWNCVGYVEIAEYPCKVLEARIKDGLLSPAPVFQMHTRDFIRLGCAEKYRGVAQVVTAGFPCQPFSNAGNRLGELDDRNGWPDTITIIRIVQPRYILLENVSSLVSSRYFGTILGDLSASGYDCQWDCIPASAIGLWIVGWDRTMALANRTEWGLGDKQGCRLEGQEAASRARVGSTPLADTDRRLGQRAQNEVRTRGNVTELGREIISDLNSDQFQLYQPSKQEEIQKWANTFGSSKNISHTQSDITRHGIVRDVKIFRSGEKSGERRSPLRSQEWWAIEPELGRVAHGVSHRVDRLKALGNGQVPAVVREVWRLIS